MQGGGALTLALQRPQRKLDVLARPQGIGREVRARTKILARLDAANGNPVRVLVVRIGDLKFGEDRMSAQVFEDEALLSAELPAKLPLPFLQLHFLRLAQPGQLSFFS